MSLFQLCVSSIDWLLLVLFERNVVSNSSGMYLLILSANSGPKKSNDTTLVVRRQLQMITVTSKWLRQETWGEAWDDWSDNFDQNHQNDPLSEDEVMIPSHPVSLWSCTWHDCIIYNLVFRNVNYNAKNIINKNV